jgi:hypothetical protein
MNTRDLDTLSQLEAPALKTALDKLSAKIEAQKSELAHNVATLAAALKVLQQKQLVMLQTVTPYTPSAVELVGEYSEFVADDPLCASSAKQRQYVLKYTAGNMRDIDEDFKVTCHDVNKFDKMFESMSKRYNDLCDQLDYACVSRVNFRGLVETVKKYNEFRPKMVYLLMVKTGKVTVTPAMHQASQNQFKQATSNLLSML